MKKEKNAKRTKRQLGISQRLSLILGMAIIVCLAIMTILVTNFSGRAITDLSDDQLFQYSATTVAKVDAILSKTTMINHSIQQPIEQMLKSTDDTSEGFTQAYTVDENDTIKVGNQISGAGINLRSQVTGNPISASRFSAETNIINTMIAAMDDNEDIVGVGVLFEPGAFSKNDQVYAPYMNREDFEDGKVENLTYDSYETADYYAPAKADPSGFGYTDSYTEDGVNMFSAYYPIKDADGNFIGVVDIDFDASMFDVMAVESADFPGMYVNIINNNGSILYSTHTNVIGKAFKDTVSADAYEEISTNWAKGEDFSVTTSSSSGVVKRFYTPLKMASNVWWVQTAVPMKEYKATNNQILLAILVISAITVIVLFVLAVRLISNSLKPLNQLEEASKKMSVGDFDIKFTYARDDEIGTIMKSMDGLVEMTEKVITDLSEKLEEMGEGNFQVDLADQEHIYQGAYVPILTSLNEIRDNLSSAMKEIRESASQVTAGADQISSGAQALAQGSTEQASSVEELSGTMNEISKKVDGTAARAKAAAKISQETDASMQTGNDRMQEMSKAMEVIITKSNDISKIIKTIDDIAFQTNILSLNAAIEAARAGSAGKGFAVVADEVGNLAKKSQQAAQSTATLIEETLEAVQHGGEITDQTAEALKSVAEGAAKINTIVAAIAKDAQDESAAVSQITTGIDQISSVVQTNSATAQESAAASEELSGQAVAMNQLVAKFRLKDDSTEVPVEKPAVAEPETPVEEPASVSEEATTKEAPKKSAAPVEKPKEVPKSKPAKKPAAKPVAAPRDSRSSGINPSSTSSKQTAADNDRALEEMMKKESAGKTAPLGKDNLPKTDTIADQYPAGYDLSQIKLDDNDKY